ncbi:hypothetical protein ACFQ3L_05010 [Lacticaseibacillus jixianensis]|uniref:VanZ family protein n=1 Tax=Lacticaseibacillus jixianensis TaxID=2486012 RepID=A0ABW4B9T7_9LACO|nr:hypothetical protein [Lacticaseibacillus jixianensis]
MLEALRRLLAIALLGYVVYLAYDSRVYQPGEKIDLKKDGLVALLGLVLLLAAWYIGTLKYK